MTLSALLASPLAGQSAQPIRAASPLVAIPDEAAPRLIVDQPLPEALSRGAVFVQYRAENMRILPVFGTAARDVSPRIGHVHITVDDNPWHFVDTSGETIIVVGLPPGEHRLRVELADPVHHAVDSQTISFRIPPTSRNGGGH